MAYLTISAFDRYITISASTGRLDEDDRDDDRDDDREDDEGYDLLADVELTDEDYDRPSMGFYMPR